MHYPKLFEPRDRERGEPHNKYDIEMRDEEIEFYQEQLIVLVSKYDEYVPGIGFNSDLMKMINLITKLLELKR